MTTSLSTRLLATSVLAAAVCLPAHALVAAPLSPITVLGYGGTNGTSTSYGYNDNSYTGTGGNVPGGQLSGGKGDLADGVKDVQVGSGYGNWSPYVMWDGVSPVLTFDLGASHNVASVVGHFMHYPSAAVYLPSQASIRFSMDGLTFSSPSVRVFTANERLSAISTNDLTATLELLGAAGQGRFVELTLQTAGRWTALSEVSFYSSTSAVPEPASWLMLLGGLALAGTLARRR